MKPNLLNQDEFLELYPISEALLNCEIKNGNLFVIEIQDEILIPKEAAEFWYQTLECLAEFKQQDRIHAQIGKAEKYSKERNKK